jgi:hypothetical protein
MAQGQGAEYGYVEGVEVVKQRVDDGSAAVLVAGELVDAAECDTSDAVECSGVPESRRRQRRRQRRRRSTVQPRRPVDLDQEDRARRG